MYFINLQILLNYNIYFNYFFILYINLVFKRIHNDLYELIIILVKVLLISVKYKTQIFNLLDIKKLYKNSRIYF